MAARPLHLILLAGGRGLRAAGEVPKQFRSTGRGLLFSVSLKEFLTVDAEAGFRPIDLVLAVADSWRDAAAAELEGLDVPWTLAPAGVSRTASTWNSVRECAARFDPRPDDLVAVHDAARPFATADLLARLGVAAVRAGGAIPGVPVPDTIVQDTGDRARYLDRSSLLAVQTPQVFRWDLFQAAHAWAAETEAEFTDDGGLLAERGDHPEVVAGEPGNWKVTTDADWRRAVAILESS